MLAGGDGGEGWGGSCCNGLFGLEGSRPRLPFKLSVRTTGGGRKKEEQSSVFKGSGELGLPQGNKYRQQTYFSKQTRRC